MHSILEEYEAAWVLTQKMYDAAKRGDWDGLVALEDERAKIINHLKHIDVDVVPNAPGWERKRELINKIIAYDEEIKVLTQDWMRELREILGTVQAEQKLRKTYDQS